MGKTNVNLRKIKDRFLNSDFFYGVHYPFLLGLIVLFSFVTQMQLGGFAIFLLFACYILVKYRDATPILPLLIFLMPIFRDISVTGNAVFYIMLLPLIGCLIYHFIKFPPIPFCPGKLFLPFLAIIFAMFTGGLLSPYLSDYANGLLYTIPLGPGLLIIYLYFNNYLRPPEGFDSKKYLCLLLVILGFICTIEFAYYYLNNKILQNHLFKTSELGWANVNGLGAIMLVCIPACCYLILKNKNIITLSLIVILFYVTIFLTGSDGALGVGVVFLPLLVFFTYIKLSAKHKRIFIYIILTILLCLCVGAIILQSTNELQAYIDKALKALTNDSGRSALYRDAIRLFEQNPIFGGGMGYYNDNNYQSTNVFRNFSFHSTLFTVLGCMGVIGLIAYAYYFYARYRIILERDTVFNLFIYFSFSMFECYGFVDTCEFSAIPQMILITLIIIVTDLTNIKGNSIELPLLRQ